MNPKQIAMFVTFVLALGLGVAVDAQTVIYVDDDAAPGGDGLSWATAYDSLSTALSAAQAGDQIWVAAGTYVGNFTLALEVELYGGFAGTETELPQRDWTANLTILDGNQSGSVVTSPPGATETTRIDGFTITNGSGTVSGNTRCGGGVYLDSSSPTIANNTITGNSISSMGHLGHGGGLYLSSSSPTIANNTITGNSASHYGGGLHVSNCSSHTIENNTITDNSADGCGGGLYLYQSSPTIANNTIAGNSASSTYGEGGGLYLNHSSPTIANNVIAGNSASSRYGGGGGGLCVFHSAPVLTNNTIRGNSARYACGGGLRLRSSTPTITNNAITGNSAKVGGGLYLNDSSPTIANNAILGNSAEGGGGLYLYQSSPTIANATITGNSADQGGGLYLSQSSPTIANTVLAFNSSGICQSDTDDTSALRYNCVYGNAEYDYSGVPDPTGTDGNISADPMLADWRYGNVHIQPGSPCADAGSNADALGDFDMDGEPRIRPPGGTVDIGADESNGTVWPEGPYAIVRVSLAGDDANDGSSWALAKCTVRAAIDAASAPGGEVWVQAGTYEECITLHAFGHLYGGFAGNETLRDDRNWVANVTTLDAQHQGSVVTVLAGHGVSTIDGFTITNGSAELGGGLHLFVSSPTIANNTIRENTADWRGGGLYLRHSSPAIADNTITGNSAYDSGGGLYLWVSSPMIASNTITGNSVDSWGGGGLYLFNSPSTIENNTITGNSAPWYGGGVHMNFSSPTIANNTITGNSAGSAGGGLYLSYSSPTIANTIVAFNSSGIRLGSGDTLTLRHNCVYGNAEYDYSGVPDPTGTDGNISADPMLAHWRYGNVHIQPDSPCVDAGSNADMLGDFDMDGESRIQPPGGTVDIGADESDGTVWPEGPYAIVRVSPAGDDANNGSSWSLAKRTVQAAIDAACAPGGDVWIQAGTYEECITLHPYAYVYGGFTGIEPLRDERDWFANVTTLDGQQQGSVVISRAGYGVNAIDGFTITNGRASRGGGAHLRYSSPTIANNTITGNWASFDGGGLYLLSSSSAITNNTITGNRANWGGGVYLYSSSPTIANTILAFNSSGIRLESGDTLTLRHNCVHGNTEYDYSGLTDPTGTDGNISADPVFVQDPDPGPDGIWGTDDDDLGDVHLLPGSPCIDGGDNAAVPADVASDLDGCARFVDDPATNDCPQPGADCGTPPIVDMGAYEYRPGDCDRDCDADILDYADFAGCLLGPDDEVPSECQCFDLDASEHVDLADFAVFQLAFTGG